jgi:penicillin-binding protein 1A
VSLGEKRYGNVAALPIWARLMKEIHQTFNLPATNWKMPDDVVVMEVCQITKDRPTKYCPREKEIFLEGTEPPDQCQAHTGVDTRRYHPDDDIFLH